jgi:hypothetical protein
MIFSDLPSPAAASSHMSKPPGASRRRETGAHPASSAGQAFSGSKSPGISAILPHNARSRRLAERAGARGDDQMEVIGLTWDRYMWPLATGGDATP